MIYSWPFALQDPEFSFIAKSRAVTPPYKKGLRCFVLLGGLDPGHLYSIAHTQSISNLQHVANFSTLLAPSAFFPCRLASSEVTLCSS